MKKILSILILLVINCGCNNQPTEIKSTGTQWNQQKREQYLNNRNNSRTWDKQMFENDKEQIGIEQFGPFEIGVFPVPSYHLIGKDSFKGLGNKSEAIQIKNRKILMNSFFVEKNELNMRRLNVKKNEVFFQIMVLTDTIDNESYNLNKSIVSSRNHPDYLGQGFIKTKNNRIDYLSFQTAENNSYAIINTRIFDLNFGKTILIAPQKDGTLKSLQLRSPELTSDSIIQYTKDLSTNIKVIKFFDTKENI